MSGDGDATRRIVGALLAIAFCIGVAGMVGQGLLFLTKAYGIEQSRELVASSEAQIRPQSDRPPTPSTRDFGLPSAKPERPASPASAPPAVRRPRLSPEQAFAAVMSTAFPYRRTVLRAAGRYAVDPALVFAIIASESRGDPEAVSPSGAVGLMQLMPTTADALGVDPYKPEENIEGAVRYLSALLDEFKSVDLSLVAYNAGPGFAERYRQGRVDLGAETRAFLMRVAGLQ